MLGPCTRGLYMLRVVTLCVLVMSLTFTHRVYATNEHSITPVVFCETFLIFLKK